MEIGYSKAKIIPQLQPAAKLPAFNLIRASRK